MGTSADSRETGPLVDWDRERAFGFIQCGRQRLFVHRRAFDRFADPPELGDVIAFQRGSDPRGRPCAVEAAVVRRSGRRWVAVWLLVPLCALPVAAVLHLRWPLAWVFGGALIVNLLTFFAYHFDKQSALTGTRRTEEILLHFLALLGGWPAAFLAQRVFRHKTSKTRFQVVFWLIVGLHQLVAVDALRDWRGLRAGSALLRGATSLQK